MASYMKILMNRNDGIGMEGTWQISETLTLGPELR